MTSILLCGHGRMGRCLEGLIREAPDLALAGILEPGSPTPLPPPALFAPLPRRGSRHRQNRYAIYGKPPPPKKKQK